MSVKTFCRQIMQRNGDWAYGPLMIAYSICSITTQVLAAFAVLFFPVSTSVVSKRLLWPNKQRKDRWLQPMKLETETEVTKDNEMKIFEIITLSLVMGLNCRVGHKRQQPLAKMRQYALFYFSCILYYWSTQSNHPPGKIFVLATHAGLLLRTMGVINKRIDNRPNKTLQCSAINIVMCKNADCPHCPQKNDTTSHLF